MAAHANPSEARAWHQTALTAAAGRHGRARRIARLPAAAGRSPHPRARKRPSASHQSALIPRASGPAGGETAQLGRACGRETANLGR